MTAGVLLVGLAFVLQWIEEGQRLLEARRFEEAVIAFEHAVANEPTSARAHYYLGVAHARAGELEAAVGALREAGKLGPSPAVAYELGAALVGLGRYEEAKGELLTARRLAPNDARIRVQLGFVYYELVEGEKAERELLAALELEPRNSLAHFYLGLARAALGKLDRAADSFTSAVAADRGLVEAEVALGRVLSQSGRDAEATAALERAVALDPSSPGAHNELGKLALRRGDRATAVVHFERALASDPDSREASYNLALARGASDLTPGPDRAERAPSDTPGIRLVDVTRRAGIRFVHDNGASGRRYTVEFAGGGVIVLDFDDDGRPDLFFVNGAPLPGAERERKGHALYRNRDGRTFEDVTSRAGLEGAGYGMGGAAADVDDDGDVDLFVTAFGEDELFRNNGDGTFTGERFEGALWSTSAAFFDADADGFVDLYVTRYLDYAIETHRGCVSAVREVPAYCHPEEYSGAPDGFYSNRGDGTFEERTGELGFSVEPNGKGLGVVVSDYDDDGDPDVYVANDTTPNFLFRNEGPNGFREAGLESGLAYNGEGLPEAGMGVDVGDYDRDGRPDVVVTNFDFETNTLYRNLGSGFFIDATAASGLGAESLTELAFGCELTDLDDDGWVDLVVTNGHILDNISEIQSNLTHAQPGQFFHNRGGTFANETQTVGDALAQPRVGRGLASLDFDGDGDRDLALAQNGGEAALLRNDGGEQNGSVTLRLVGTSSNRDGIGARLRGTGVLEELRAGSSYLAQSELTIHLGLGKESSVSGLVLRWPSGREEPLPALEAGRRYVVKEGVGILKAQTQTR